MTWAANYTDDPWPKALLPLKLPNARVLAFGYDAPLAGRRVPVPHNQIANYSQNLLISLASYRDDDSVGAFWSRR
jgi:hypothetical protein